MNGFVYFLRSGEFVKIGFSSNPPQRLQAINCASPDKPVVLGIWPGTRSDEKQLHKRFAGHRYQREWFRNAPEIEAVAAAGFPPSPERPRARPTPSRGHVSILVRIKRYCLHHRLAATTFGRLAVNDGKLVDRLRSGRTITLDTVARIEDALASPPASRQSEAAQ